MPRIAIDLERLRFLHCGLGQYSRCLGQALLDARGREIEWTLLLPDDAAELLTGEYRALSARVWRRENVQRALRPFVLPLARGRGLDLWHMTHQDSRYFPWDPRVPMLLTIHDLNFLREKSLASIRRRLRDIQRKIDRAAAVTTISKFVAGEVEQHLQLRGKPLTVVYNGATPGRAEQAVRPAWLPDGPFLFTLGDIAAKKNFHVLLEMMRQLPDYRLVIAGNKSSDYAQRMEEDARSRQLSDRVFLPGKISDGERYWLYQNCEALVFPSKTEGFGLPVIEAMSLGKPVFVSHATSLPEVAGPLGFYWHDYDAANMATVFRAGMEAYARDADYAAKLRAHAARFTWERAAGEYLEVYERVLTEGKGRGIARRGA